MVAKEGKADHHHEKAMHHLKEHGKHMKAMHKLAKMHEAVYLKHHPKADTARRKKMHEAVYLSHHKGR